MAQFKPRTTAPTGTEKEYSVPFNPFFYSFPMPNCTAYAWGRFAELSGTTPRLSTGSGEEWWGYTSDGYARGQTPKLGAVICWRKGSASTSSDGAGHVAIVEAIYSDGSILTSNSDYQGRYFYTRTLSPSNDYSFSSEQFFQGFIYNPVNFDGGTSGYITGNRYLSESEMKINARYIWNYLRPKGWSLNAVAGMLGNMETESTINPGIWQNLTESETGGFGLTQWTPAPKYLDWCSDRGYDPSAMNSALDRILYELEYGLQYYETDAYPLTFSEFKVSSETPEYLAQAFLYNYEKPADMNQPNRSTQARKWYDYLISGSTPTPTPGQGKGRKMSLLLMWSAMRRK